MNSPLARVILSILGGYLVILLFWIAYDWIEAEFPRPADKRPGAGTIQHPFSREQASDALQRFSRLPQSEREAIKETLESSLISMEQWLTRLDQSDCRVVCLGELHEESTRSFLAEEFFAKFGVDVLLLEAMPEELKRLVGRANAGRTYFPLLDADIMDVLRAARIRNPDVKICGIEETDEQQRDQRGRSGSRDRAIARNFWENFQPGMCHAILFGALHCASETNWLFDHLRGQAPLPLKHRMLNALVLEENQNGPLEAFVFFLDEIGIEKENFVMPDTRALHPRIYEWFQLLNRQILEKYSTLVVFRA